MVGGWGISCEITVWWLSLDLTDDKSTLVQVMAWCCQATSHYLSQCWPISMMPYCITRAQWVKCEKHCLFSCKESYRIIIKFQSCFTRHKNDLIILHYSKLSLLLLFCFDEYQYLASGHQQPSCLFPSLMSASLLQPRHQGISCQLSWHKPLKW